MKKLLLLALLLGMTAPAYGLDKKIVSSNTFKIDIYDTAGNGLAGLTLSNLAAKVQCTGAAVTIDESGDTLTDEGGGFYRLTTNDTLTLNAEDECNVWVEGSGDHAGLLAKTPARFKAIGATMDSLGIGVIHGTASGSSTATTVIDSTNLTSARDSAYIGWVIIIDGESAVIKGFSPSTDTITLASTLSASAASKSYILVPQSLWEILNRARRIQ